MTEEQRTTLGALDKCLTILSERINELWDEVGPVTEIHQLVNVQREVVNTAFDLMAGWHRKD